MSLHDGWRHLVNLSGARVLCVGKGPFTTPAEALEGSRPDAGAPRSESPWPETPCAFLTQIHSADVLEAVAGHAGEGDGLVTRRPGLPLAVATADCLPVVLADTARLAVVHAGWRGLAAGVLARAVELLGPGPESLEGWIGPAIGPCCYEVGEDVARVVSDTLEPPLRDEVVDRRGRRPHLDLPLTARRQLASLGVGKVVDLGLCTCCRADSLWSYRRDGAQAGRNHTIAWLPEPGLRSSDSSA